MLTVTIGTQRKIQKHVYCETVEPVVCVFREYTLLELLVR
jgi:hypothetical protein